MTRLQSKATAKTTWHRQSGFGTRVCARVPRQYTSVRSGGSRSVILRTIQAMRIDARSGLYWMCSARSPSSGRWPMRSGQARRRMGHRGPSTSGLWGTQRQLLVVRRLALIPDEASVFTQPKSHPACGNVTRRWATRRRLRVECSDESNRDRARRPQDIPRQSGRRARDRRPPDARAARRRWLSSEASTRS